MWFRGALLALGVALTLVSPTTTVQAQEITFEITNDFGRDIQVEFYSQNRNHAWPGGNRAYNLNRGDTQTYKLACQRGEKICYGGWVKGNARTYWGVGLNGKQSCDRCCVFCGDGVLRRTLN
ncbi:MAG: hypothetical protein KF826_00945 [Xanthobacteraceae bacterium]|nr:hypothetical protein [Xanthobacteraceae bacterium]MCW5673007.1 hypothetical protein [Xanthobacteraceae bacterium]MCW5677880.1 hypothetical protein [Xanthobacteraceae bacterium]